MISAFNWIFDASNATEDSNLKWILKMDDDVLLNTKELKNYIDGIGRNDTDSIYCRVYTKAKAIREKKARAKDKNLEKWYVCIIWQYGLWSFQTGGAKLERLLPKNQHTAFPLIVSTETIKGRKLFAEIRYSKEIIEF